MPPDDVYAGFNAEGWMKTNASPRKAAQSVPGKNTRKKQNLNALIISIIN